MDFNNDFVRSYWHLFGVGSRHGNLTVASTGGCQSDAMGFDLYWVIA